MERLAAARARTVLPCRSRALRDIGYPVRHRGHASPMAGGAVVNLCVTVGPCSGS